MKWRLVIAGVATAALLWGSVGVWALDIPQAPPLNRPIIDTTHTLSDGQISDLANQIAATRQSKDYQIGILMIPTLGTDEYLEGYSIKVAREWGIGDKTKDNGVLILVVKNDRKVRIEVGRGLEGNLTDAQTGRIIRNVIAPEFRNGNYAGGLSKAIESIQAVAENRSDPNATPASSSAAMQWWHFLPVFGFVLIWLGAILGRSKSWWAGGVLGGIIGAIIALIAHFVWYALLGWGVLIGFGLLFDFLVSRSYRAHGDNLASLPWWTGGNWGGGSGGGWGGGSGGGFGGGGFSGGGSSGSW